MKKRASIASRCDQALSAQLRFIPVKRRQLGDADAIEAARALLKRVVEMLTRLIHSTAHRQTTDRDRYRDRGRERVGAEDSP